MLNEVKHLHGVAVQMPHFVRHDNGCSAVLVERELNAARDLLGSHCVSFVLHQSGVTHQELSYRLPQRAAMARLRGHLTSQGWRRDPVVYDDGLEVYRRSRGGWLFDETAVLWREGQSVRIGVIACVRQVGCW